MYIYKSFATVYDLFMKDTPYDQWIRNIESLWSRHSFTPKSIVDLGCGTGNITERFALKGYDMIGVDFSVEMLSYAKEKSIASQTNILYVLQDMREIDLYGTVDCFISICDSINYILEEAELLAVFKLVNNFLNPKGLFVFDFNTIYKYETILADNTFAITEENAGYIWENSYYEDDQLNEYNTNFFIKHDNTDCYKRYSEVHYQRAYSIETLKELIKQSGLELVDVCDAMTLNPPNTESERVYMIAREVMK